MDDEQYSSPKADVDNTKLYTILGVEKTA